MVTSRALLMMAEPWAARQARLARGVSDKEAFPPARTLALRTVADPETVAREAWLRAQEALLPPPRPADAPPDLSTGAKRAAHRLAQIRLANARRRSPVVVLDDQPIRPRAVPTPPKDGKPGNRKTRRAAKRRARQTAGAQSQGGDVSG